MDPAPTLLDYQSLAAEAETVILRHGLAPRAVHLYPVSPYNTPRVVVTIDPAALRSLFPEHTSRISGNVLLTREVVDGRVLIESGEYLPKSEPA